MGSSGSSGRFHWASHESRAKYDMLGDQKLQPMRCNTAQEYRPAGASEKP